MPQEQIKLTVEQTAGKIRYRKKYKKKTFVSRLYDSDSRRNKSEAWQAFKAWRAEIDGTPFINYGEMSLAILKSYPLEQQVEVGQKLSQIFREGEGIHEKLKELSGQHRSDLAAGAVVKRYLGRLKTKVEAKQKSIGLYGQTKAALNLFVDWYGKHRSLEELTEDDVVAYADHLLSLSGEKTTTTLHGYQKIWRTFIRQVSNDHKTIAKPDNLGDHTIQAGEVEIDSFTIAEVKKLLGLASERLELHLLLMLQCGFYPTDLSDLKISEVDLKAGRIIRKRSKESKAPKINWKLWKRTLELLTKQGNKEHPQGLMLTKLDGTPLIAEGFKEDGNIWRNDAVRSNFRHLARKAKVTKSLKHFRKTGATVMEGGPYAEFVDMYLDHSRVAKRHYLKGQVVPKFDKAMEWLGKQFGF